MQNSITLQDKEYPIAYNMYRLGVFFRKKKLTLQDGLAALDSDIVMMFEILTDMLNIGAKKNKTNKIFKVDEVGDMVGSDLELIAEALASFLPGAESDDDEPKQTEAVGKVKKRK